MNLCVIPARGGSKRIPQKNIKPFFGKPMIAWSIETALQSGLFAKVVVSTDCEQIAAIAREFGAEVPFIRPKELADDFTGTTPVVRHAIETLQAQGENFENVCCIYATAPFTQPTDLQQAAAILAEQEANFVFSVGEFAYPIQRALKILPNQRVAMFAPEFASARSQDLEPAFHDAGQFYFGRNQAWLNGKGVFGNDAVPYILPAERVQDIDTPADWRRAEVLFEVLRKLERQNEQGSEIK